MRNPASGYRVKTAYVVLLVLVAFGAGALLTGALAQGTTSPSGMMGGMGGMMGWSSQQMADHCRSIMQSGATNATSP